MPGGSGKAGSVSTLETRDGSSRSLGTVVALLTKPIPRQPAGFVLRKQLPDEVTTIGNFADGKFHPILSAKRWGLFRLSCISQCTHTGRPLGTREFIGSLEREMHRNLAAQKRGRPRKVAAEDKQGTLVFEH